MRHRESVFMLRHLQLSRAPQTKQGGFGLLDLLISLSLMLVLTAWAVPAGQHAIERAQAQAAQAQLLSDLRLAQQEAMRRGETITISPQPTACETPTTQAHNWSCGWHVYVDHNHNQQFDEDRDTAIAHTSRIGHVAVGSARAWLRYSPVGRTSDVQTFEIGSQALQVIVSWVRVRT